MSAAAAFEYIPTCSGQGLRYSAVVAVISVVTVLYPPFDFSSHLYRMDMVSSASRIKLDDISEEYNYF